MQIFDFTNKYNRSSNTQDKEWKKNWSSLLKNAKESNSLALCFHTLLEKEFSFSNLKEIIEYDENGKKEILNDENTFKWACAYGNKYLIIYLNDKVNTHNIPGAINATFLQYRLDNLQTLELLGYEKEIYTEPNLCQAISRANQVNCGLDIVEYLLQRIDKFPKLSSYVWNELEKQEWLYKIKDGQHTKTLETLLSLKSDKIKKEILNHCNDIMGIALVENKVEILNQVMKSYIRKDFVEYYQKIKNKNLKENLSVDENNNVQFIIETYPELIKHADIKLFMMNNRSLKIDELIKSKRTLTQTEIKKSFIELSKDESCLNRLLTIVPDFDYKKFKISEAIKIVNQLYEAKKYDEIDYEYDGEYMSFNRNILLKNKDFNEYKEEIRQVIYDEKMYDLVYKEQIKNNLENKLGPKQKAKQMKI